MENVVFVAIRQLWRVKMDTEQRMVVPGRFSQGFRRLTPGMLETAQRAADFDFKEAHKPGQIIVAFKTAAPFLGYGAAVVHAIDFFFSLTKPVDWQPGCRPIVWPSSALQQSSLCIGASQVKRLNRRLVELGLIVIKDSPNGKRYGRRAGQSGPIIEAYGFDLSPLADRLDEFERVIREGRELKDRLNSLRRRATIVRRGIKQLADAATDAGLFCVDWPLVIAQTTVHVVPYGTASSGVEAIEQKISAAEAIERDLRNKVLKELSGSTVHEAEAVNMGPKGSLSEPHITTTNQLLNPSDTVSAREKAGFDNASASTERQEGQQATRLNASGDVRDSKASNKKQQKDTGPLPSITPDQLIGLAPMFRSYLGQGRKSWPDVVDAADLIREHMGVSRTSWGEACVIMGREQAAIAVALISLRPESYFRSSPGAYFHGMVVKAKAGTLNLAGTIWGIRKAAHKMLN
jgi:replication initiation protein RepC